MGKYNQLREDSSITNFENVEYITYVLDADEQLQTFWRWRSEISLSSGNSPQSQQSHYLGLWDVQSPITRTIATVVLPDWNNTGPLFHLAQSCTEITRRTYI
jgi:hypothetical protein